MTQSQISIALKCGVFLEQNEDGRADNYATSDSHFLGIGQLILRIHK